MTEEHIPQRWLRRYRPYDRSHRRPTPHSYDASAADDETQRQLATLDAQTRGLVDNGDNFSSVDAEFFQMQSFMVGGGPVYNNNFLPPPPSMNMHNPVLEDTSSSRIVSHDSDPYYQGFGGGWQPAPPPNAFDGWGGYYYGGGGGCVPYAPMMAAFDAYHNFYPNGGNFWLQLPHVNSVRPSRGRGGFGRGGGSKHRCRKR
jgi:hypothetical protein